MVQVRVPGQDATTGAEVQAAFAQIVCRTLWEERTRNGATGPVKAEPMLHQYLETTLEGLGPLRGHAQDLLEKHLIDGDGSRMLLMEQAARRALAGLSIEDAGRVLRHLEEAVVLHAEEHQGSRYFELGHDWLARKVLELRKERVRQEQEDERLRQELERQKEAARRLREEQARREEEVARKLREESAARRRLLLVVGGVTVLAVVMGLLFLWALGQQQEAERARAVGRAGASFRARDNALMAGAREQMERGGQI